MEGRRYIAFITRASIGMYVYIQITIEEGWVDEARFFCAFLYILLLAELDILSFSEDDIVYARVRVIFCGLILMSAALRRPRVKVSALRCFI